MSSFPSLSTVQIKIQDPFSGMQFDSAAKAYLFKCVELLKRLSETATASNASNESSEINGERQPALPDQAQWKRIRELQHDVVNAIKQALHACVEANPEQARDVNFYINGIGSQISDTEAISLIQAVEQLSTKQKKIKILHGGVEYSGSIVVRQREQNVAEDIKNDLSVSSRSRGSHPSNSNGPSNRKDNLEDRAQEIAAEPEVAAIAEKGIVESPSDGKEMAEVDSQSSDLAISVSAETVEQKGSGDAQDNLPFDEKISPEKTKRVAKTYSEVKHPDQLVRELRECYQVSQESFARRMKVSFATVNRWENGHSIPRPIAVDKLKKLTKKLDDRGDDLMERHFPEEFKKQRKKKGLDVSIG